MVALLCCAVGLTAVQIHRRYRFKARLLENEDQLGALLTRGSSVQSAQQQLDSEQEDSAAADDDALAAAVAGLSRPASPAAQSGGSNQSASETEP
eukprot:COSAG06_NODE_56507_length_284_cov_0.978378_1_plen_94_part_11